MIKKIAHQLSLLNPLDPFRIKKEEVVLHKLYRMGIIKAKLALSQCEKLGVSAFCRRRLAVVMTKLKMAETVSMAVKYIEQGHVRVGPQLISDPAFLVTRAMEDAVTWVDSSKIKRKIMQYNDKVFHPNASWTTMICFENTTKNILFQTQRHTLFRCLVMIQQN